jgi:hypothetical protein
VLRSWKEWLALVGVFLFFGAIITYYIGGVAFESDLPKAIGVFGIFTGYALAYFPEYLRLRLWPFLAASSLLSLVAAITMLIHSRIPALICALASLALLCTAWGLRWKKARQQAKD